MTSVVLICFLSYLLGAIPFSLIVARSKGVDLRQHGSGNAGATNVYRVMGKGPGALVFVLDCLKGVVATVLISQIRVDGESLIGLLGSRPVLADTWPMIMAGAAAMLGHVFTIWGRLFFGSWRGGKGVATGTGMLAGLIPVAIGIGVLLFIGIVALTRTVSLGSILASASLPLTLVVGHFAFGHPEPPPIWVFAIAVPVFILWTHRANVKRLIQGTEPKFSSGS